MNIASQHLIGQTRHAMWRCSVPRTPCLSRLCCTDRLPLHLTHLLLDVRLSSTALLPSHVTVKIALQCNGSLTFESEAPAVSGAGTRHATPDGWRFALAQQTVIMPSDYLGRHKTSRSERLVLTVFHDGTTGRSDHPSLWRAEPVVNAVVPERPSISPGTCCEVSRWI
jgi:hypothetical protein